MENIISALSNFIFVLIVLISLFIVFDVYKEKYRKDTLYGRIKRKRKETFIEKIKFFKVLKNDLEKLLLEKNKEEHLEFVFNFIIGFVLFISLYLIFEKQVLLAILVPFGLFLFISKLIKNMSSNLIEHIEQQLPQAIDHFIRSSSKNNDLKDIIYETSRHCENPTKQVFEGLSRKIVSGNTEQILMDFAESFDNVWIYSFIFTIISYLEDSNKEDTIKNLRHLRNILEKENGIKRRNLSDKKYGLVINYTLAGIGAIAGVLNILFNPIGRQFFFSTFQGILCFILGYSAILGTILINIIMAKGKRK